MVHGAHPIAVVELPPDRPPTIRLFLGAIALGALAIRMNTLWPLVALHALNDFLQFTATGGIEAQQVAAYLPILKIGVSGALAAYGLILLRGHLGSRRAHEVPIERTAGA